MTRSEEATILRSRSNISEATPAWLQAQRCDRERTLKHLERSWPGSKCRLSLQSRDEMQKAAEAWQGRAQLPTRAWVLHPPTAKEAADARPRAEAEPRSLGPRPRWCHCLLRQEPWNAAVTAPADGSLNWVKL